MASGKCRYVIIIGWEGQNYKTYQYSLCSLKGYTYCISIKGIANESIDCFQVNPTNQTFSVFVVILYMSCEKEGEHYIYVYSFNSHVTLIRKLVKYFIKCLVLQIQSIMQISHFCLPKLVFAKNNLHPQACGQPVSISCTQKQ